MKPEKQEHKPMEDIFHLRLGQMLDQCHAFNESDETVAARWVESLYCR